VPQLEPRSFSFNSPYGACEECNGLGSKWRFDPGKVLADPGKPLLDGGLGPGGSSSFTVHQVEEYARKAKIAISKPFDQLAQKAQRALLEGDGAFPGVLELLQRTYESASEGYKEWLFEYMSPQLCTACKGARLKPSSLAVRVKGVSIGDFTEMPLDRARGTAQAWELTARELQIGGRLVEEITNRLDFLCAVGLEYLNLQRSAATLSGGEAQRIRLATQIGSRLRGVLYVLDEPSIGLHPRDNERLIQTLSRLRDLGNTVLVVEHDEETISRADWVIDLGPGAGRLGGHVVGVGTPEQIAASPDSLTGRYMSGAVSIEAPSERRSVSGPALIVRGAQEHNLRDIDVVFPLGKLIVITGVSGSGKSTLVHDILYRAVSQHLYGSRAAPGAYRKIEGIEHIDKIIEIDQAPIGRTPRSNPATYTGVFTPIRDLYAMLPESRERGYKPGRFSFNVKGGRCEACQGDGLKRIEMNFLPDVYVTCDVCRGRRYNHETLQVKFKSKSIADLLETTVEEAAPLLESLPQIHTKLKTLADVGLGYIHLGQPATTLSGGEAQRIKLARELSRRQTGSTFYILDEPTTGLHFEDVRKLLDVLQRLVDLGNTVLVIEHQIDVIKSADWIIDLGPEGGVKGGMVVANGTPGEIMRNRKSFTGQALSKAAGRGKAI
jgi:excinuclease ABC subunit A